MQNTSDAKATWKNVAAIDLKEVREQLNLRKGWWWLLWHNPMDLELEYRRFLFLLATNHGQPIVPWSDDLDDFWLEHQRDTLKYAADCYAIIGAVMNQKHPAAQGTVEYQNAWQATRELYQSAFRRKPNSNSHVWNAGNSYDPGISFGASADGSSSGNGSHSGGHHDAGGHTAGGHHGCGSHGGSSHSCGGGGHGCGGHGCGGHGCGGGH